MRCYLKLALIQAGLKSFNKITQIFVITYIRTFFMTILERYIFRTITQAFLLTLFALTGVIWIVQALLQLGLLTTKSQSIFTFFYATSLAIPPLLMFIAPIALFIAAVYTLNKLNSDSELIVMNAAGLSPLRVLKPLVLLAVLVSIMVASITLYIMPASFLKLRDLNTLIRSSVSSIMQEGRFITYAGLTFHCREKKQDGTLISVLVEDRRDKKTSSTYLAERGAMSEIDGAPYLILEKGSLHRQEQNQEDTNIVAFDRYAIDLNLFAPDAKNNFKARERSTYELFHLDANDPDVKEQIGRFRAELHDRFANPLYPFVSVFIAFAVLGAARTTRQGRGLAILIGIIAVVAVRLAGISASNIAVRSQMGVLVIYLVPLIVIGVACFHSYVEFSRRLPRFKLSHLVPAQGGTK
jgi:lipopolysaccharide export system permease protein